MEKNHKIDFVFYKGISWTSKLIRWKNNSEYSHVEVMTGEGTKTLGAFSKGVQYSDINQHKKGTHYDVYRILVTEKEHTEFWRFMRKQEGKKYDWKGIFGYVDKDIKQDKDKWYCSELCYFGLIYAGVNIYNRILKFPSPFAFSISKDLELIDWGIVGQEKETPKEEEVQQENDN